jgi:hypothetical protein
VTFTLSPPVRIAAMLGLVAAVVIGGGMMVLGRGEASASETKVIQHRPFGPGANAKTEAKKPAAKRVVQKAAVKSAAVRAALAAGLPAPLANALGRHQIVVVSLYNPYSRVDAIAFAEARAGAQLAGAGFVPLNVLSKPQVGKLTEQLGLLPNPGLLVYTRPATLAARMNGFADKETVAQAAQNAARGT